MTRRGDHFDALLRHLGAAYYQTLRGQATPSDVARALDSVAREEERERGAAPAAEPARRTRPAGRWRVRDVMTTDTVTVDKRTTGAVMARLMSEHHINALPVLTGGRRVAGVVSEADLLRTQHAPPGQRRGWLPWRGARRARPEDYTAAQLMTAPAVTIHPDAPLAAAARRMTSHNLTMLPVVDASGELIGVVSRRDLLRVFLRPDDEIAGEVSQVLTSVLLLDPEAVTVTAHDGLVTLTGQVERPELAALATRLAGDVDGVLAVVDNLSPAGEPAGRQQG
jgi:CBS domain-containing protein